jgi:hypothetical protein
MEKKGEGKKRTDKKEDTEIYTELKIQGRKERQ